MKQMVNGQLVDMTQSEIDEYNERNTLANNTRADRKLGYIKQMRLESCLLYTSPSPRDRQKSRMPSSA